jgi:hypothetical protein
MLTLEKATRAFIGTILLTQLRKLYLGGTKVTYAGLRALKRALPNLKLI